MNDRVQSYYDASPECEWERLERHRMEFAISLRTLLEHLPPAPASILDIGGGPGRYALALSQLGYHVTLLDLSQSNLAFAHQKSVQQGITLQDYIYGNALDLTQIPEEAFDAVLLMGPLYHLFIQEQRLQAALQARRVLKSGGLLFGAFITRYAALRDIARRMPYVLSEDQARWEELLRTGVLLQDATEGFIDAYFAHPTEIQPLMEAAGLTHVDMVACEGITVDAEQQINLLTGQDWDAWVDMNYRLSRDQTIYGSVPHLLYVGRK
jgi:S-adenosylmethionine-dependent methyltransferase